MAIFSFSFSISITSPSSSSVVWNRNLKKLPPSQHQSLWLEFNEQAPATPRAVGINKVSCFFNPIDEPILKQALKEPVAFMGGMFAGLLRLDLSEDPLKEWVRRTVEASGITQEIDDADASISKTQEEAPQQIEIE